MAGATGGAFAPWARAVLQRPVAYPVALAAARALFPQLSLIAKRHANRHAATEKRHAKRHAGVTIWPKASRRGHNPG
jgi:hypothetical protein